MQSVKCSICESRDCVEPWTICGECSNKRIACMKTEDKLRNDFRMLNFSLIGRTTPGTKYLGCSVNERRGRKVIRHFRQDAFLEEGDGDDEPERDS